MISVVFVTIFLFKGILTTSIDGKCSGKSCENDFHLKMTKRELLDVFEADHKDKVPSYFTAKVDGLDNIKHDSKKDQEFVIKTMGKELKVVRVKRNAITIPDHQTTEYHDENGPTKKIQGAGVGFHTHGEIENDEWSTVNLHHSGKGISGSVQSKDASLLIKPLPLHMQNDDADHVVLTYPAEEQMRQFNKYLHSKFPQRPKRSSYSRKVVEMTMVADWKMVEFYGAGVSKYLDRLANVIAGYFRDPSLTYPCDLVLVRKVIWTTDKLKGTGSSDLLDKFQDWWVKNNPKDDADPEHGDIGVLVTRDGCLPNGCEIGGLANMVNCDPKSVAFAVDKGLQSSTSFAHEIGHIMGVGHDESVDCPTATFIMSADSGRGGAPSLKWSFCASEQIRLTLLGAKCYDDIPTSKLTDSTFQMFGQILNKDQQCDALFGHGYEICKIRNMPNSCGSLYCANKRVGPSCRTGYYPMLHGTNCGNHRWCIFGACVGDGERLPTPPPPVHGNWGAWSDFTKCSKPCGVGIRWKERKCDNPEPSNGGRWCDPWAKKRSPEYSSFETCNTHNCKKGKKVLMPGTLLGSWMKDRKKQCKEKKFRAATKRKFVLKNEECNLLCGANPLAKQNQGWLGEGTYCEIKVTKMVKNKKGKKKKKKVKVPGTCVRGKCKEYGCDFVLHSDVSFDRCGTCGGNGTRCLPLKEKSSKQYMTTHATRKKPIYLMTIPKGARNFEIKEKSGSFVVFGWGIAGKGKPKVMGSTGKKKDKKLGLKFNLKFGAKNFIKCKGVLPKSIDIYVGNPYMKKYKGYVVSYLKPLPKDDKLGKTKWDLRPWEDCTATCGPNGFQLRHTYCIRTDDGSFVDPRACPKPAPPTMRSCNKIHCPGSWVVSKWAPCSKSCATGRTTRTMKCMALSSKGDAIERPANACPKPKPPGPTSKTCNRINCDGRWEIKSNWSKCSHSCGGGIMKRRVECWQVNAMGIDMKVRRACDAVILQKPKHADICNLDKPCAHWNRVLTKCSSNCGNGTLNVSVVCESEIKVFPDSECNAGFKPKVDKSVIECNLGPCMPGEWKEKTGICTKSCGGGERAITTICQDKKTGEKTSEDQCDENRRPHHLWQDCNEDACPLRTEWKIDYSKCSATCGTGVIKGTPYCRNKDTGERLSNLQCDSMKKPAVFTRSCNLVSCEKIFSELKYHWIRQWLDCPVTCGNSTEFTKNICVRREGKREVGTSFCSDQTPPKDLSRACSYGECPAHENVTYSWHVQDNGCAGLCGDAHHELEINCLRKEENKDHVVTSPSHCNPNTKPTQIKKPCKDLPPCPKKYSVKVHHGLCDVLCGSGHKIRLMTCYKDDFVDFNNCKPLVTRSMLKPRDCKAEKKCTKGTKTPDLPPLISLGCWQNNTSPILPDVKGSAKEAEHTASALHDVRLRSCAIRAEKKFERLFGLDEEGNCIGVKDAEMYAAKKEFKRKCPHSTEYKNKYFLYRVYVWKNAEPKTKA